MTVVVPDFKGFLPQVAVIRPLRARRGWLELRRKWHYSTNCLFLASGLYLKWGENRTEESPCKSAL